MTNGLPDRIAEAHWLVAYRAGCSSHYVQTASAREAEQQLQATGGALYRWSHGQWAAAGWTVPPEHEW